MAWKSRRRSRQPISSRWISGPASQMTVGQSSVSAMQAPLDILAQEPLHQFLLVRFEKAPQGVEHDVIETPEPASVHQRLHLGEELDRNLRLDTLGAGLGFHSSSVAQPPPPRPHGGLTRPTARHPT